MRLAKKKILGFWHELKNGFFIIERLKWLKDNFSLKACWLYFKAHFSLRHVFCVQGILKVLFLYSVVVMCLILTMELPSIDRSKPCVAIYGTTTRIGELLLHKRTVTAARNLGWNVISARFAESTTDYFVMSHFYYVATALVNLVYKPQFSLAVTHYVYIVPYGSYNIVYLNVPNNNLFKGKSFLSRYKHLGEYDGYIDLYSVVNGNNPNLTSALNSFNKKDAFVMPLYLSQHYVPYSPATREQALIVGSLWGCNRSSIRISDALYSLAQDGLLLAYGLDSELGFLGDAFKGTAEDYDKNQRAEDNLFNIQKKYGISLVIHSLEHMVENIPTSRIAESIASGSIVISDHNGFVKKFFGDNVLYLDALTPADQIYSQIKDHINWIKTHPIEVEEKTKAAHEIFMNEFALENQLQKLYNALKDKGCLGGL